jgi:hypothetical protein
LQVFSVSISLTFDIAVALLNLLLCLLCCSAAALSLQRWFFCSSSVHELPLISAQICYTCVSQQQPCIPHTQLQVVTACIISGLRISCRDLQGC